MQQVIVTEREEGYTVEVPTRPDFVGQASTYREAVKKLIEAFSTLPESTEHNGVSLADKGTPIRPSKVHRKLS